MLMLRGGRFTLLVLRHLLALSLEVRGLLVFGKRLVLRLRLL
jgi:hypothetical protein